MADTTNDKSLRQEAKSYTDAIKQEIRVYEQRLKRDQDDADQKANAARIAQLDKKVDIYLHGDPDQRGGEKSKEAFGPMTDDAATTSGGKAYENLKSTYQELVRLAIAFCYVFSAYARTGDRLMGGGRMIENALSSMCKGIIGAMSRIVGMVELHEDIEKVSRCDVNGKIVFDPFPSSLFTPDTPKSMIHQIASLNQFVVEALLTQHGYEADAQGVYYKNGQMLTANDFDKIKKDPENGFRSFMTHYMPVKLTQQPMGPRAQNTPTAAPIESPEPENEQTSPSPRPL